jgi:hypothetical protein
LLSVAIVLQSLAWPANPSWMAVVQQGGLAEDVGAHPLKDDSPATSAWEVVKFRCIRLPGEAAVPVSKVVLCCIAVGQVLSGEDSVFPAMTGWWRALGNRAPPVVFQGSV